MSKNILFGLSTQNRSGKYLYYGAYDTDNIQSLVSGEIGIFWASKTAGPDSDTGVFTSGGNNDDLTSLSGSNIDIADTPSVVPNIDTFYFAQGVGSSKVVLGNLINPKTMKFKVLEYVAPVKKIQTVTIAAASLVAGKIISFSAYAKSAPVGAVGTVKEMNVEYLIPIGATATTIGAALKALIDAHSFSVTNVSINNRLTGAPYLYSCSEAHSSDVVLTITWNTYQDGDIKNNSWATATSVIATSTAFKTGNGTGVELAELEKECAVQRGYNPHPNASLFWTDTFSANTSSNYHLITISSTINIGDQLGANQQQSIESVQYLAIDTSDTDGNLLEEIVSLLSDISEKRAVNGAA